MDVRKVEILSVIVEMNIEYIKKHDALMTGMVQGTDDNEYFVPCTKE